MNVLALDTSGPACVACVLDTQSGRLAQCSTIATDDAGRPAKTAAERVLTEIDTLLAELVLARHEIEAVGVGVGPGSFTGVRVGVATAKGVAFALGVPIVGVPTMEALAARALDADGIPRDAVVATLIDAFKGEIFAAVYGNGFPDGPRVCMLLAPHHVAPTMAAEEVRAVAPTRARLVVCGTGLRRYKDAIAGRLAPSAIVLPPEYDTPQGAVLARLAVDKLRITGPDDLAALEPLYVRPSDATLPATPLRME